MNALAFKIGIPAVLALALIGALVASRFQVQAARAERDQLRVELTATQGALEITKQDEHAAEDTAKSCNDEAKVRENRYALAAADADAAKARLRAALKSCNSPEATATRLGNLFPATGPR